KRYRTAHERECLHHSQHADISGQETIELKAGQTAFWSGHLIHRGIMKKNVERMTLSGMWQQYKEDDVPQQTDPRFKWLLAENLRGALPEAMRPLYDRWRRLQVKSERAVRWPAVSNWIARIARHSPSNRFLAKR